MLGQRCRRSSNTGSMFRVCWGRSRICYRSLSRLSCRDHERSSGMNWGIVRITSTLQNPDLHLHRSRTPPLCHPDSTPDLSEPFWDLVPDLDPKLPLAQWTNQNLNPGWNYSINGIPRSRNWCHKFKFCKLDICGAVRKHFIGIRPKCDVNLHKFTRRETCIPELEDTYIAKSWNLIALPAISKFIV